MLCLECGAEMRLVQVIKDTTMLVAGYEHQTWQCSGCSTVERRRTFNRETPRPQPIQTVPLESAQTVLMEPIKIVPGQPSQAIPIESIQPVSANSLIKWTEAAPAEPTIVPPVTHPEPSAALSKMNARAKALDEKLYNLKERAKAAREAAGARATHFNRDRDSKSRGASSPSPSSEASSHVQPDEPLRLPPERIACPSHAGPIVPGESNAPVATMFRKRLGGLVRAVRRRELAEVRFSQVSTP